jgi:PIF1-like helicase
VDLSLPFGGKVFVGIGDFRQVAPVIKGGGFAETFNASVRSSYLWPSFTKLSLTAPVRNASDPEFSFWVDTIGEGDANRQQINGYDILIPRAFIQIVKIIKEAIKYLFP